MCPVMQLWHRDAIIRYSQYTYNRVTHTHAHTQPKNRNIIRVKSNICTVYVRYSRYHPLLVVPKQQRPANPVIIVTLEILCIEEFEFDRICYHRSYKQDTKKMVRQINI